MAYNQTDPNTQPPQGRMSGFPEMKEVGMSIYKYRELKQRRRLRERQKSSRITTATGLFQIKYSSQSLCPQLAKAIRWDWQNNNFARAHAFLYIS